MSPRAGRSSLVPVCLVALLGCSAHAETATPPAGVEPQRCAAGELALPDGRCEPAGVPPGSCASGFSPDGDGGCDPILPADACPFGQMALPGETACREVAPCGDEPFGDIPIDAMTELVDQAYGGDDSDGSRARPWRTIQEGIDAAEPGALVAVAAGTYEETLVIDRKPVRLRGRCPGLVTVAGRSATDPTILIFGRQTSSSEIAEVAISGAYIGIGVVDATSVVLRRVWVHDTAFSGVDVGHLRQPTSALIDDALIERTHELGVRTVGADVTIEATVARDVVANAQGDFGWGLGVDRDPESGLSGSLTVRASLIERNQAFGISVYGSNAAIEATVVRDTVPDPMGRYGRGIAADYDMVWGERARLDLRSSVIERNRDLGVLVQSSDATVEATVVRDALPDSAEGEGKGIVVQSPERPAERGSLTLRTSLLARNREAGVLVLGSDAAIEATVLRDTQTDAAGNLGPGVAAFDDPDTGERGKLTLRTSLFERNHQQGVYVSGSDADIEGIVVRDTLPDGMGKYGRGLEVQNNYRTGERGNVTLSAALFEQNRDLGVLIDGSDARIEAVVVRDTGADQAGFGDGVAVVGEGVATKAIIASLEVDSNARAGLLFVDAEGEISGVTSMHNRFGLVVQGSVSPALGDGNAFEDNAEQDELWGGDLTVPNAALPLP